MSFLSNSSIPFKPELCFSPTGTDLAGSSWRLAAEQYRRDRAGRPLIVETEPERLKHLRDLLKDSTSFSAAYYNIARRDGGAPQTGVETLMFSLRERGTKALEEPATKRRLSERSDQQVIEVGNRLQR